MVVKYCCAFLWHVAKRGAGWTGWMEIAGEGSTGENWGRCQRSGEDGIQAELVAAENCRVHEEDSRTWLFTITGHLLQVPKHEY